ncbi:serine/threonine protein kinase [Robbsia andropogonis]|uniref:Serine/threonine protein kinase n=1 Tax=Robbsia andropogonis TaxID=28092 RepID=A0A0F5JY04_9BURK|nr:ATPase domain-containing protein [Robbsia andropogonis]KKB62162.1 serine/threonine protein kinase [Robbsia andropogonis]MCP1119563.1 AAA family ATPase [Robbsia andropogonis]MCP1129546.1 AAA family ATPase [Robbsia andropogonis]
MGKQLQRVQSGVPGLDTILCGGVIAGSSYIIQGMPGAGKTILANQVAFGQARAGSKILYVTLLAESHDRLFQSLSTLDFFDASVIGTELVYISLFQTLRDEGLSALVAVLRKELSRQQCSMLVMDGLLNARDRGDTDLDVKSFVAELQGHAAFTHCTVLFLTSARIDDASPEHTMVDGVIQLQSEEVGSRTIRQLKVTKSRGSDAINGMHQYNIASNGISVYPRLEAVLARPSNLESPESLRVPSGITGLDPLIGGGLPASSVTLLLGPSGSGKTTCCLNFLTAATPEHPALYFGFYETRARLTLKAAAFGIDLEALIASGAVYIMWNPLTENLLDALGHQLLEAVRQFRVHRVAIDGFGGFERAAGNGGRLPEFLSALSNELRALRVTTVATLESRVVSGAGYGAAAPALSSVMDNLLLIRQRETPQGIARAMIPVKVRDSVFDSSARKLFFNDRGLFVDGLLDLPFLEGERNHETPSGGLDNAGT